MLCLDNGLLSVNCVDDLGDDFGHAIFQCHIRKRPVQGQ